MHCLAEYGGASFCGTLSGGFPMLDIQQILKVLPHRYPLLLVDRILELEEGATTCRGLKNVSMNEPYFQGHYPDIPIMPGVLILESMAQVGAVLLLSQPKLAGRIPLIGAIENAKFRRMVRPGDTIIHDVELLWVKGGIGKMKGVATVDGEVAAQMEMLFKLSEKEL